MEQAPLERIHHKKGSGSDIGGEEARAGGWVVKNGDTGSVAAKEIGGSWSCRKIAAWPDKI